MYSVYLSNNRKTNIPHKTNKSKYQYITMALDKKSLKKLRDALPFGSSIILKEQIFINQGLTFSVNYINQVLDPEDKKYNTIIIEESLLYAEELKKKSEEEKKRVAAL